MLKLYHMQHVYRLLTLTITFLLIQKQTGGVHTLATCTLGDRLKGIADVLPMYSNAVCNLGCPNFPRRMMMMMMIACCSRHEDKRGGMRGYQPSPASKLTVGWPIPPMTA